MKRNSLRPRHGMFFEVRGDSIAPLRLTLKDHVEMMLGCIRGHRKPARIRFGQTVLESAVGPINSKLKALKELESWCSLDETLGGPWGDRFTREERIAKQLKHLHKIVEELVKLRNFLDKKRFYKVRLLIWMDDNGYLLVDSYCNIPRGIQDRLILKL